MFPLIVAMILYLSLVFACGRFTANYAEQRGCSRIAWFIWGGLFFPLPYIALALLPPIRGETTV
jgi:hypothetical protein